MNSQEDSYCGWIFAGRDVSDHAIQQYPRDEMLLFKRLGLDRGVTISESLSVPRFKFVDAVEDLGEKARKTEDPKLASQYREFTALKRAVDCALCDIN